MHFLTAVLLLVLGVCAVEVGLRVWQLNERLNNQSSLDRSLTTPSAATWIGVKPLLNVERKGLLQEPVLIQTDGLGLRSQSPPVIPKPDGLFRVVCLGGDAVFGSEVNAEQSLPAYLQFHLQRAMSARVEVINAGCPQAGPLVNFLRYRHYLNSLQPDLVLVCLRQEDLIFDDEVRASLRLDETKTPAFAPHPAITNEGNELVDGLCEEFITVRWAIHTIGGNTGSVDAVKRSQEMRFGIASLAALAPIYQLTSSHYGQVVVSIAPDYSTQTLSSGRRPTYDASAFERDIRKLLQQAGLSQSMGVWNSSLTFQQLGERGDLFLGRTDHLSPAGNNLYAFDIARFLLQSIPGLGSPADLSTPSTQTSPPEPIPFSPASHSYQDSDSLDQPLRRRR